MNFLIYKILKLIIKIYTKYEENGLLKKIQCGGEKNPNEMPRVKYPFNVSHPDLIYIGKGTTILENSRLQVYPELTKNAGKIYIGKNCYFCYRVSILATENIMIGDNVLIASDVTIVSYDHGMDPENNVPYMDQKLVGAPIMIGDNCWIGDRVSILSGVSIGDGCVIGTGSVVTKNIPSYSIAVGSPAKVIKHYDMRNHGWILNK